MVRQAHTYLVGAVSGATLIAVAIAAFVLLVSAQVFGDWPIAGLGGAKETAVHESQPVGGSGAGADTAAAATANATTAAAGANAKAGGNQGGAGSGAADDFRGGSGTESQAASDVVGGGGQGGSGGAPSNPGTTNPGSNPSSPSTGSSGGSSGGSGSGGSSTASSPSQSVTDTVNDTVNSVDQTATGGALEATGVTTVTEGVVNGVAGPESVVGKTVDGVAGTVGGLLNPKP
jgi:hypothetical protein